MYYDNDNDNVPYVVHLVLQLPAAAARLKANTARVVRAGACSMRRTYRRLKRRRGADAEDGAAAH